MQEVSRNPRSNDGSCSVGMNGQSDDSFDDKAGVDSENDEQRRTEDPRTGCLNAATGRVEWKGRTGRTSADNLPLRPESRLLIRCSGGFEGHPGAHLTPIATVDTRSERLKVGTRLGGSRGADHLTTLHLVVGSGSSKVANSSRRSISSATRNPILPPWLLRPQMSPIAHAIVPMDVRWP